MGIRDWWANDPAERYWMEALNREELGEDLRAPLTGQEGREVWHYRLVSHTRPADVDFHWHTELYDRLALVGWSTVLGPLREEEHEWTPHAGPLSAPGAARPNWVMPLGGIHHLDEPASIAEFEHAVELEAEGDSPTDEARGAADMRSGGQGFLRDTARKLAIERHAVMRAIEHYRALGATDNEILGKPYDIRLQLDGEEVHVEVKGSGNELAEVLVTRNEVEHARTFARTELVVVHAIEWERSETG